MPIFFYTFKEIGIALISLILLWKISGINLTFFPGSLKHKRPEKELRKPHLTIDTARRKES